MKHVKIIAYYLYVNSFAEQYNYSHYQIQFGSQFVSSVTFSKRNLGCTVVELVAGNTLIQSGQFFSHISRHFLSRSKTQNIFYLPQHTLPFYINSWEYVIFITTVPNVKL